MSLQVVNWNVQWTTPRSRRTPEILNRIHRREPQIVCLTEADHRLFGSVGYTISSQPDYGYPVREGRRKALLWSRNPWEQVDDVGIESLPPGRFIAGVTRTSLGPVAVIGVCIPWFGSRTRDKRRARWEDHGQYLSGLAEILGRPAHHPRILLGDFNQIVGAGCRAPRELQLALQKALEPGLTVATAGLSFRGRGAIDHIALGPKWKAAEVGAICNFQEDKRLSDHFGVFARVSVA